MTFRAVDVYELLEPLLKDYRKLRLRNMGTSFIKYLICQTDYYKRGIPWFSWMSLYTVY